MSRLREMTLRVVTAVLVSALSSVQRRFGNQTTYKVGPDGAAAQFEGAWFAYRPKQFGSTGNIDSQLDAENETRRALVARLSGNETFWDIGAHGGVYTITLRRQFPALRLHSFEPQPEDLLENLRLNGLSGETVHRVAVGAQPGIVKMTTKARSSNHVSESGDRSVSMVRLDDYAAEHSLPLPGWIKIDIEGLELPALRGAERILRESQPNVICEINHLFGRYGSTISDLVDYMAGFGLKPHRLTNGDLHLVERPRTLQDLGYSADNNFWFMRSG